MSATLGNIRGISANVLRAATLVVGMTVAMGLLGTNAWAEQSSNPATGDCTATHVLQQANQVAEATAVEKTRSIAKAQEKLLVQATASKAIDLNADVTDRMEQLHGDTASKAQDLNADGEDGTEDGDELLTDDATPREVSHAAMQLDQPMKATRLATNNSRAAQSGSQINGAPSDTECSKVPSLDIERPDLSKDAGTEQITRADAMLATAQKAETAAMERKEVERLRQESLHKNATDSLTDGDSTMPNRDEKSAGAMLDTHSKLSTQSKLSRVSDVAALQRNSANANATSTIHAAGLSKGQQRPATQEDCVEKGDISSNEPISGVASAPVVATPMPATEDVETDLEDADVASDLTMSEEDDANVPTERGGVVAIAAPAGVGADMEVLAAGVDRTGAGYRAQDPGTNVLADTGVSTQQLLMLAGALLGLGIALTAGVGRSRGAVQSLRQ